jgi:hypothetical protein
MKLSPKERKLILNKRHDHRQKRNAPPTTKQKSIVRKDKYSRFYFLTDSANLPRATVCLTKEKDSISRGIALCSMKTDFPNPEEGCFRAWKCAKSAMAYGGHHYQINRTEALDVVKSLTSQMWKPEFSHRAMFDVLPANTAETKLFKELKRVPDLRGE